MPTAPKMRWRAVNVGLHWFVYAFILLQTITGVILYLGYGGWWVWVHSIAAVIGLAYIFLHVVTHYFYGGWWQLLRLFRPARLVPTRATRSFPLLVAIGVGLVTLASTRPNGDVRKAVRLQGHADTTDALLVTAVMRSGRIPQRQGIGAIALAAGSAVSEYVTSMALARR